MHSKCSINAGHSAIFDQYSDGLSDFFVTVCPLSSCRLRAGC